MKIIKSITAVLAALVMLLGFTGCGGNSELEGSWKSFEATFNGESKPTDDATSAELILKSGGKCEMIFKSNGESESSPDCTWKEDNGTITLTVDDADATATVKDGVLELTITEGMTIKFKK